MHYIDLGKPPVKHFWIIDVWRINKQNISGISQKNESDGLPLVGDHKSPLPHKAGLQRPQPEKSPSLATRASMPQCAKTQNSQLKKMQKNLAFSRVFNSSVFKKNWAQNWKMWSNGKAESVACEPWKEICRRWTQPPVMNGSARKVECVHARLLRQHPS